MSTIWDLLPASLWPTQPFIPPDNPNPWPSMRPSQNTVSFPLNPTSPAPDRYAQMYDDAKRAHDFAMWLFRPPTENPPSPPPPRSRGSSSSIGKMDPSWYIESKPLESPPMPPFEGYGEGDRRGGDYVDDPNVDPGIIAPMPRSKDPLFEKDPSSIFAPYSPFRGRRLR